MPRAFAVQGADACVAAGSEGFVGPDLICLADREHVELFGTVRDGRLFQTYKGYPLLDGDDERWFGMMETALGLG